jgi:hypothetical protein
MKSPDYNKWKPFRLERRVFTVQTKTFTYQFEDQSPRSVRYECSETEILATSVHNGVPFITANRAGMLTLAKLLLQLSLGEHDDGFHVHLRGDFGDDGGKPDVLTLCLSESPGS